MSASVMWRLIALALVLVATGCGQDGPESKRDIFIRDQRDTETTRGPIDTDSVKEFDDKVRYSTKDGSQFEVKMEPCGEDEYRYEEPQRVK